MHLRMSCEEPRRIRVGGHIGQPRRSWIIGQHPEDAKTAGSTFNRSPLLRGKPESDEALEFATRFVEGPDRGVPRGRNRAGGLRHTVQQYVQIELSNQFWAERDQLSQPVLFDEVAHAAFTQSHVGNPTSRPYVIGAPLGTRDRHLGDPGARIRTDDA